MSQINRKLRTRKALMNGGLELVAEGQHFSSLSLREVAKRAGVVPNAFYRHFKNLDELGLALADEVGLLLRQLMRQARLQGLAADRMISDSVDFFISHVMDNPALFRFMSQSLTGGTQDLREAIRNELSFFATELVADLNRLRILTHVEAVDLDMMGHLVVQTVSSIAGEILDLPPKSENLVNAIRQRTIKELRLIFLGASVWSPKMTPGPLLLAQNPVPSVVETVESVSGEVAQREPGVDAEVQMLTVADAEVSEGPVLEARLDARRKKELAKEAKAVARASRAAAEQAVAQAKASERSQKEAEAKARREERAQKVRAAKARARAKARAQKVARVKAKAKPKP